MLGKLKIKNSKLKIKNYFTDQLYLSQLASITSRRLHST